MTKIINFKKNNRYFTISAYAFLTIAASIILYLAIANIGELSDTVKNVLRLLSPFTYGFIFAYICNPLMKLFENKVFAFRRSKKDLRKLRRALSVTMTLIVVSLLIVLFFFLIIPQVIDSYMELQNKINYYLQSAQEWANNFVSNSWLFNGEYSDLTDLLDENQFLSEFKKFMSNSFTFLEGAVDYLIDYAGKFVTEVKNIVLGIVIAVYLLLSKEKIIAQSKKICASVFNRRHYLNLIAVSRYTNKAFGGFFVGTILDSLMIGLVSFIVYALVGMPYYPLLSVIAVVSDLIPFFGPIIGTLPALFIVLISDPGMAIWLIIIILIIQQVDGNIIKPLILGDSIGLSGLWVIVAIVIFGGLFGIAGLLLGVPAFAVIYTIVKQLVEKKLRKKCAPVSTDFYMTDPPDSEIDYSNLIVLKDEGCPATDNTNEPESEDNR